MIKESEIMKLTRNTRADWKWNTYENKGKTA